MRHGQSNSALLGHGHHRLAGMRRMASGLLVVLTATLAACSGREDPEETVPEAGPEDLADDGTVFRGELYQTGSPVGTITMLSLEDEEAALRLTGGPEEELRRLTGARVKVEGEPVQAYPDRGLEVERYEILEIDGERPHIGIVEVGEEDEIWLREEEERSRLRGAPASLAERDGATIWVVGERRDGEVHLSSYGIIRP